MIFIINNNLKMEVMYVIKRDGTKERVSFDKVSKRLEKLVEGNEFQKKLKIDYLNLAQKVCGDIGKMVRHNTRNKLWMDDNCRLQISFRNWTHTDVITHTIYVNPITNHKIGLVTDNKTDIV